MRIFVPLEDWPADGANFGPLVPYQCGYTCVHDMREPAPGSPQRPITGEFPALVALNDEAEIRRQA